MGVRKLSPVKPFQLVLFFNALTDNCSHEVLWRDLPAAVASNFAMLPMGPASLSLRP